MKMLKPRLIYQLVNVRDADTCRCCGHKVSTTGGMAWRSEHHHLHKRKTVPKAQKHTTKNVLLVCARCHHLITNDKIRVIGKDADKALAFVRSPHATAAEMNGIHLRDERKPDERVEVIL